MKNLVIIIAVVFLLKPILPVLEYAINYDYISKTLCINKAKPKMQCNGKCHLMKELAKASENDKPLSSNKKNVQQENEVLFFEVIKSINSVVFSAIPIRKLPSHYSDFYCYLDSKDVFHPPIFIS